GPRRLTTPVLGLLAGGDGATKGEAAEVADRLRREAPIRLADEAAARPLVVASEREGGEDPAAEVRLGDAAPRVAGAVHGAVSEPAGERQPVPGTGSRPRPPRLAPDVGELRVHAAQRMLDLLGVRCGSVEGGADPSPVGDRTSALAEDDAAVAGRTVVLDPRAGVGDADPVAPADPVQALGDRAGCDD